MLKINVIFSDTKEVRTSLIDSLQVKAGFLELENVRTYVDYSLLWPYLAEIGLDLDGGIMFQPTGVIYFDAVDKVTVVNSEKKEQVIFEKHY